MNEKEKMLNGELYNSNIDERLVEERINCKTLCFEHNQLAPKDLVGRTRYIKEILGSTGERFLIEQPFTCDYGYNISIGENFYSNHNLIILDPGKVSFGNNVFIGPNCSFYTAEHPLDAETRNKELEFARPITVGNNVWFGGSVVVIGGVNIGDNCVIGAGSVVTKDIPANSLAVGNPCKVIKNL